jgi:hypothetical protein
VSDRDVSAAYRWANGMVMVFGVGGEQLSELQGPYSDDLHGRIQRRSTPRTTWVGFGEDGPAIWPPGWPS